jgi:hypothetical protein
VFLIAYRSRTLRTWRVRFFANLDAVRALGYSDSFIRLWEYCLCYCEGAFLERYIGDVQMIFTKPGWKNHKAQLGLGRGRTAAKATVHLGEH